ncbi:hypothetical protein, partial [Pseudomonas sp. A-R-19]|uniref:hypothetical protein n=1 Tax=Pseudomonas sp. A-R-19 TaxID=2832403 RepID=UPI001CBB79AA
VRRLCTGTRLLSLSTIAEAKISNPPWVNFQSAGWVSFQSAPTLCIPALFCKPEHFQGSFFEGICSGFQVAA